MHFFRIIFDLLQLDIDNIHIYYTIAIIVLPTLIIDLYQIA